MCYKCREPWFPGHKKVCKLANKNQILALQAAQADTKELVYITEESDSEEETEQQQPLQLSMHALNGIKSTKSAFTLSVTVGDCIATALVDSSKLQNAANYKNESNSG